jgi:hypothetical protein
MAWQWKSARRATRPEGTTLATPSLKPPLALRFWQPAILVRARNGPRQSACVCRICSDLCTCRRIGPAVTQWQARPFAPTGFKGSTYTDTKTGHAQRQDGERRTAAAAACLSSGQEGPR